MTLGVGQRLQADVALELGAVTEKVNVTASTALVETASSEILFRWVAEAVRTLALPPDAVGPIVTLGWLHHGLSPVARDEASRTLAPGLRSDGTFAEWMARVWLSTPGLGTGWSSWRR